MNVKNNGFEFLNQVGQQVEVANKDALCLRGFISSFRQETGRGTVRCANGRVHEFSLNALREGMVPAEGRFVIFSLNGDATLIDAMALDPDRLDQLAVRRTDAAAVKCPHCGDYVVPRESLLAARAGKRVCPHCFADFESGRMEPAVYSRLEVAVFGGSMVISVCYSLWAAFVLIPFF